MTYLISQMLFCLIVAFLLGLFLGYLLCKIFCKCKKATVEDVSTKVTDNVAPVVTAAAAPVVIDLDTSVDLDGDEYGIQTLEGIGKHTGDLFRGYGIETVGDYLRNLNTPAARQKASDDLGIKILPLDEWASMADLLRINGVDHQAAELAFRSGVETVGNLATRDAFEFHEKMKVTNQAGKQLIAPSVASLEDVGKWIKRAKNMKAVVEV